MVLSFDVDLYPVRGAEIQLNKRQCLLVRLENSAFRNTQNRLRAVPFSSRISQGPSSTCASSFRGRIWALGLDHARGFLFVTKAASRLRGPSTFTLRGNRLFSMRTEIKPLVPKVECAGNTFKATSAFRVLHNGDASLSWRLQQRSAASARTSA